MSRIEQLIRELCPEGVPRLPLTSVANFDRGLTYQKADEDPSGDVIVLRASNINQQSNSINVSDVKRLRTGFQANPRTKLHVGDILLTAASGSRAHIGKVAYVSEEINAHFGGFMMAIRSNSSVEGKYLFHFLTSNAFRDYLDSALSTSTINNINSRVLSGFDIPVPPLQVQREIVSILDKFTQLEAELDAELEARRTQYGVTRDRLLDFNGDLSAHPMGELIRELCPEGVPKAQISDHFLYEQPTKYLVNSTAYLDSGTPVLTAGQTFILGYTTEEDGIFPASTSNPVVIFDDFTTATKWVDFPFKAKSSAMKMITPKSSSATELRFLFHWMGNFGFVPGEHARHWISVYSQLEIPWPPLEVQREVVSILDKLDALVNDITYGLPAEIEARRKQYEYHRNKLLTFKELDAA